MPEGPEIRRVADRLADALVGQRLEQVSFGIPRLERHEADLTGRRVVDVTSQGKALLTRFEGGAVLYSHNQLYGRWYVCPPGRPPKTNRSLRVALHGSKRWALLYSASDVEVLEEHELRDHAFLSRLGPDLLDATTTPSAIRKRLADRRFAGRSLGGLLLDQGFLAGVGNYLRSEILFFAGLPPEARPRDLDDDERALLSRVARSVTRRSYKTGGVTEEPAYVAEAKRDGQPRRLWRHAVFARAGKPCRRCGTRIERIDVASRRLYLCPACQAR